ncbi:hypothetical protein Lal_00034361 [Lupinus albus]|nr:hypothetical protein Lal_00034361 [Lupinus albus]
MLESAWSLNSRSHLWTLSKGPGGKFNSNGRFGFQAKLVSSKPGKNVGFTYTRISDQNNLEQIVILVVHSVCHVPSPISLTLQIQKQNVSTRASNTIKKNEATDL